MTGAYTDLDKFWESLYNDLSVFFYENKKYEKILKGMNMDYQKYCEAMDKVYDRFGKDIDEFSQLQHTLPDILQYKELPPELRIRLQKMLEQVKIICHVKTREFMVSLSKMHNFNE